MEEEFAKFLHEKKIKEHVRELLESSGVTEPGPTRAWARASKAIVNYIHNYIHLHACVVILIGTLS